MKLIFGLLLMTCVSATAADDPFVGTWKLNTEKSQYTGFREDVKDLGGNKYEFAFGDDKQTIVADGIDHQLSTAAHGLSSRKAQTNGHRLLSGTAK